MVLFVKMFLWFFGFFVFIYMGVEMLKNIREVMNVRSGKGKLVFYKIFGVGFFIFFFNLLSILFWFGIYGSIFVKIVEFFDVN